MAKETTKDLKSREVHDDSQSLKGTLFATIVFVGGAIILWTLVLLIIFIMRY